MPCCRMASRCLEQVVKARDSTVAGGRDDGETLLREAHVCDGEFFKLRNNPQGVC